MIKTKSRLRGLMAAVFATAAIVLPVTASPANAATEITFWSWRPEDKVFYEAEAAKFLAATGISVKFTPYVATDYNALLSTALTAGKGPDVMQMRAYGGMANLSDAGYFMPLTSKDIPALAKIPAGTLAGAQGYADKKQFGLPYATSVLGVMYNPDLLKKAGVKALPTTWASFLAALEKVKAAGIMPLGNGSGYAPGMEQLWGAVGPTFYGGNDFYKNIVAGKKTFEDKNFVASLQAVKDLVAYFPTGHAGLDYNTARGLFANEKAAFYIGGNYEISYFRSLNPALNVGWMPAPAAAAGTPRYVTNWADGGFAINAKTTHKAEAIKFMNFLASKAFMQDAADSLGWISTISGVKVTDPAVISMVRAIPSSGTPFLTLVGFRYGAPTSSSIMQPGFQKVAAGTQTPAELAAAIQAGVATWYAPLKPKA
ncbi:MAG: extracellular solute-binding protein [Acidobacteria bacterium]|nr:extracellular solute-binding protein [Acidobacteriota bacterium]